MGSDVGVVVGRGTPFANGLVGIAGDLQRRDVGSAVAGFDRLGSTLFLRQSWNPSGGGALGPGDRRQSPSVCDGRAGATDIDEQSGDDSDPPGTGPTRLAMGLGGVDRGRANDRLAIAGASLFHRNVCDWDRLCDMELWSSEAGKRPRIGVSERRYVGGGSGQLVVAKGSVATAAVDRWDAGADRTMADATQPPTSGSGLGSQKLTSCGRKGRSHAAKNGSSGRGNPS